MLLIGDQIHNPLPALAPQDWDRAIGYQGEARYLGLYWLAAGDEAAWDDGQSFMGGANWRAYQAIVDYLPLSRADRSNLGYSECAATHWLLLDRETRRLYLVPQAPAAAFLQGQERAGAPESALERAFREGRLTWPEYRNHLQAALVQAQADRLAWIHERELCLSCMNGWVQDADGTFHPCPVCGGQMWITKEQVQAKETRRVELENGGAL